MSFNEETRVCQANKPGSKMNYSLKINEIALTAFEHARFRFCCNLLILCSLFLIAPTTHERIGKLLARVDTGLILRVDIEKITGKQGLPFQPV